MLRSINWVSFGMGVIFALFVWPFVMGMFRGRSTAQAV